MFLYHVTLFSTCLARALALSLPPIDSIHLVAADSTVPALNNSLRGTKLDCSSNFYGDNLNIASCKQALNLMRNNYNARTYAKRNTPPPPGAFQSLPNRWLSSDGTCAIDVWLDRGATIEEIDQPSDIYYAAKTILDECVIGNPHRVGGEIMFLGNRGRLSVKISHRIASNVHCGHHQLLPPSCQAVVDAMPVTCCWLQKYGPAGDTGVTNPLPWSLEKTYLLRHKCRVTLSATSPAQPWDQGCDYKIWLTAVAIGAMCWRQGKIGYATVGLNQRLTLSFDQTSVSTLGSTPVGNLTES